MKLKSNANHETHFKRFEHFLRIMQLKIFRSDAQRAAKQKERKEKELELCAFNAEQIEDSHHTHSLVSQFWF